jgi:inhibitor of KinA
VLPGAVCAAQALLLAGILGWSIIGRSPTRILTHDENVPFLFDVGDKVLFKRIDLAQYQARRLTGDHE